MSVSFIQNRDGVSQQVEQSKAYCKPTISPVGQYNPSTYMNSQLNMLGKRPMMKPDNYIGMIHCRPPNEHPNSQHTPTLARNPTIPILSTPPVPKVFH
jgi:hypothetical protein